MTDDDALKRIYDTPMVCTECGGVFLLWACEPTEEHLGCPVIDCGGIVEEL